MAVIKVDNYHDLQEFLGRGKVFLKFSAEWCNPCKAIAPTIESLSTEHPEITFLEVDVDGDDIQEALRKFHVRSVPTFIYLDSEKARQETLVGTHKKLDLLRMIKGT